MTEGPGDAGGRSGDASERSGDASPCDRPGDLDAVLEALHDDLAATQELPVERTASRWIGEAEAVAADLATADLDRDVVHERLGHVESLLAEVETTGDEVADDHLERARELTAVGLDRASE